MPLAAMLLAYAPCRRAGQPSVFQVLRRHPRFRRLWLAQVASQAGDWLNRVAILTLLTRLQGPEAALGAGALFSLELALRMLPAAVFGPLAGPLADRLSRRGLMIAMDLARAGVVLGYLTVDRPEEIPRLYGLLLLQMALTTFFAAARAGALPDTVPRGELHAAYALSAATWSTMLALGAATGGLLVRVLGISGVFLVDAASFLASALLLLGLRLSPVPRHPTPLAAGDLLLLRDLRRALAHARERGVLPAVLAKTCWGAAGGFLVVLPVAARERFAGAADPAAAVREAGLAVGLLYAARGLGTGLGPILARRWLGSDEAALRRQVLWGFLLGAAGYACFAPTRLLLPALAWVVLAHCGGSTLWVASTTWWQRRVDDAFRGRIFAMEFLGMTVAFSAGGGVAGLAHDLGLPLTWVVWTSCGLVLAGAALWARVARPGGALAGGGPGAWTQGRGGGG